MLATPWRSFQADFAPHNLIGKRAIRWIVDEVMAVWDFERVESLIVNGVEESLTLEYKAAAALEKTGPARTELTKDISALRRVHFVMKGGAVFKQP